MVNNKIVYAQIMEERNQAHVTRKKLYAQINKILGMPLITFFTSFVYPTMIGDDDADILAGLLQKTDLSGGFALMVNSQGGDGLAAERIINICKAYSGTKEYTAIIPGKAKSAATMICLGANKLIMSETSELGPIDPQYVTTNEKGATEAFSGYNLVMSYKKIWDKAIIHQGRMEPYLQALSQYDAKSIEMCLSHIELSENIAIKALQDGMYKGKQESEIKNLIELFLIPKKTKVHGRPIYYKDIQNLGLNIDLMPINDELWGLIYELYLRLDIYVKNNNVAKCIESKDHSFTGNINVLRKG